MVERMNTFRISKRVYRDERGQSVVEMAVVMVLLLLLLVGVADFGRAFHNYIVINNASREGARYASRFPHLEMGIREKTKQEAAGSGVTLMDSNITIDGLNGAAGDPIRVTVTYEFSTIMSSLVSSIISTENLTLRASTEMVIFGLDT